MVKLLEDGFKRPVYWNECQTKAETRNSDDHNLKIFLLDASFQGVRRLFVLAFDNTNSADKNVERNSHRIYFLPRVNITNYNILIDEITFMINQLKQYGEFRKTATERGDD